MTNSIFEKITNYQKTVVRTYLTYQCLSCLFFTSAVWLYFYRLFITDAQVGILDGLAFGIGLIAEVPSGVLADKFGRGRIARLGLILTGCGFIIQGLGSSIAPFFIGNSITMIGVSLTSGADEALFFAKINFDRNSAQWRKLVTRGSQMRLLGILTATLIGGWLHTINPRLPWILTGIAFLGSALLIWRVNDRDFVKEKLSVGKELKNHFRDIKDGFAQFCSHKFFRYVPLILTVQALFYATSWGLLRMVLLDRFHFDPMAGSVVVALCTLSTVAALSFIHHHAEKISEKLVLSSIAICAAASLLASIADIGAWGSGVILMLFSGESILRPFLSEIFNNLAREEQRATVLSIASFFRVLPYVVLAPIIGALNTNGKLDYFLLVFPALIGGALLFYLSQKKRDALIKSDVLIR
ncbi:MAG: MFS transporter [Bdellovibrionales bacterium]